MDLNANQQSKSAHSLGPLLLLLSRESLEIALSKQHIRNNTMAAADSTSLNELRAQYDEFLRGEVRRNNACIVFFPMPTMILTFLLPQ